LVADNDEAAAATGASQKDSGKYSKDDDSKGLSVENILDVASGANFCHDSTGEPYVTVRRGRGLSTMKVLSKDFRHWLTSRCYAEYVQAPSKPVLQQALELFEGQARFDETQREIFLRVGEVNGVTYFDLADGTGRVVGIDGTGYRLMDESPVLFRHSEGMLPLPEPCPGGSVYDLAPLLNLNEDDFDLLAIWLLSTLRPHGPYAVLDITGEQGSAKSFASWICRSLIDPNAACLRGAPREPRDLLIAAEHSWIVALDNLSSMSKAVADALCRMTTGTGSSVKQNYADKEEVLFTACRTVVINGIPELLIRPDLADRTLRVECPPISDSCRRSEDEMRVQFLEVHPKVLGAILEATSMAIRRRDIITRRKLILPRLADVAIHTEAASPALGWEEGKAVDLMLASRTLTRLQAVNQDAVGSALVAFAKAKHVSEWNPWQGTATELLLELDGYKGTGILPVAPNVLSGRITDLTPALREQGVIIGRDRKGHSGTREIYLRYDKAADSADNAGSVIVSTKTPVQRQC
jgi:hypothetical protein